MKRRRSFFEDGENDQKGPAERKQRGRKGGEGRIDCQPERFPGKAKRHAKHADADLPHEAGRSHHAVGNQQRQEELFQNRDVNDSTVWFTKPVDVPNRRSRQSKNVTANIFSSESIDFVFGFYYIVIAGYRYTGILIKFEAKHISAEQNVRNQRIS